MADRPALTDEIEVTPEMIEAGAEMLFGFDWQDGATTEVVQDVYRAMAARDPSQTAGSA